MFQLGSCKVKCLSSSSITLVLRTPTTTSIVVYISKHLPIRGDGVDFRAASPLRFKVGHNSSFHNIVFIGAQRVSSGCVKEISA